MSRAWLRSCALIVVLFTAVGCGQGEDVPPSTDVHIEYVASERAFRVTYETSIQARALVFNRGKYAFRSRSWIPLGADQTIEFRDGREVLHSRKPSRRFEVKVPEQFGDLTGDYPFMTRFSNGGIALYTGHVNATPITCFEACTDGDIRGKARVAGPIHLKLSPSRNGKVLAEGIQSYQSISLQSPPGGVFAYFGNLAPLKRANYSVVADPKIPVWILSELDRYFPQILDLNSRRLGRSMPSDPVVLLPFRSEIGPSASTYSGAVVSSQMVLSLSGGTWTKRTAESREQFLKLLAHESFHFWNSSLFHSVDTPGGGWLHEGSADAIAYLNLLDLGVITAKRYAELQTEALNRCMIGLSGTSLPESNRVWGFRNFYECGAIIQQLVGRAAKRTGSDIWRIWSKVFDIADRNGGYYKHEDFFRLALEETAAPSVVSSVQLLTSGEVRGTDASNGSAIESFFIGVFATVGAVLEEDESDWPSWYNRLVGERAVGAALESDCAGDGYFVAVNERVKLVGNSTCRNLKGDREIGSIGRFSVWKEGVQVYEFIRRQCVQQSTIEMIEANSRDRVRLLCPQLPRRPSFLSFSN